MLQTQVNYWNYIETKRHNIATEEANYLQARAALSQAESASRNADTNAYNAVINRMNAETNVKNAATNLYNAESQRMITVSDVNANSYKNLYNLAKTDESNAQASLNKQKTKTEGFNTAIAESDAKYVNAKNLAATVGGYANIISSGASTAGQVNNMTNTKPSATLGKPKVTVK